MLDIVTALWIICFLTHALYAGDEDALKLDSVRAANFSNATMLVIGITNLTGAPVRAFSPNLLKLNDFDEAKEICAIEFSGESEYRRSHAEPTAHHIIKPGE